MLQLGFVSLLTLVWLGLVVDRWQPNAAVSTVKLTFENSVTDLQSKNYSKDPTKSIVLHYFTLYNNKHILPVRLLKVACTASEVEQLEALWNKIRTVVPRHTSVL